MNLVGEWGRLFFEALAGSGVADVVVSPGSRSTPFVVAAASEPRLACHDVADERSAAFHALGRAKASGRPVALLSTSGTAPAHYLPAVIEAARTFTPLVVLSADRPLSLQDCGASQTIDQVKLFGDHVRWFADVEAPDPSPGSLRALRRIAAQAVARALHPVPGPVHVNLRVAKPLEPGPARGDAEREVEARARAIGEEPLAAFRPPRSLPDERTIADVGAAIERSRRGLIVCGPGPLDRFEVRAAVLDLARRTGFPIAAEGASQFRFAGDARGDLVVLDALDAVYRSGPARRRLVPDLVLQIGDAPVSSGWDGALSAAGATIPRIVLSPHGWPDPWSSATLLVPADLDETLRALLAVARARPDRAWLEEIAAAEAVAWRSIESALGDEGSPGEGWIVRRLAEALPRGALLAIGNSLPIREVDLYVPGHVADVAVWSQRGAAGIDGLVSGAAGAASASGRPAALLLGDVSCRHDLGGLELAARVVESPFAVVVVDKGGGRIFEQLPVARAPHLARHMDRFVTPARVSFAAAAGVFGLRHVRVEDGPSLREALDEALARPGATLVEAVVDPHGAARQDARVRAEIERGLEEALR